jgi:hypothetical protein
MATVYHDLAPEQAQFLSTLFPGIVKAGTNFPVIGLAFDGTAQSESAYWRFPLLNYAASGNITVTVEWYCTATSGTIYMEASIAAVTPNSDAASIEAKAFATANNNTDTAMGTTKELANFDITVTNLDSSASGDEVWLKLRRVYDNAGDTIAGDIIVTSVRVSYSDT